MTNETIWLEDNNATCLDVRFCITVGVNEDIWEFVILVNKVVDILYICDGVNAEICVFTNNVICDVVNCPICWFDRDEKLVGVIDINCGVDIMDGDNDDVCDINSDDIQFNDMAENWIGVNTVDIW